MSALKIFFMSASLLLVMVLLGLFMLAKKSQIASQLGVTEGNLQSCLYASNCVNSQADDASKIASISLHNAARQWELLPSQIRQMGGEVQLHQERYLRATFQSKWLSFVDDLELYWDTNTSQLHVRSSSRVGRSDFGVNRARVEQLRAKLSTIDK